VAAQNREIEIALRGGSAAEQVDDDGNDREQQQNVNRSRRNVER
jgi:hypothetical protein